MRLFVKKFNSREKGLTLIEAVIALAVLGIVAVVILTALGTGAKATIVADEQATAESLARDEIEYIKSLPYDSGATNYPVDPSLTVHEVVGWNIPEPIAEPVEDGLQKVTVTIERDDRTILSVVTYKGEKLWSTR